MRSHRHPASASIHDPCWRTVCGGNKPQKPRASPYSTTRHAATEQGKTTRRRRRHAPSAKPARSVHRHRINRPSRTGLRPRRIEKLPWSVAEQKLGTDSECSEARREDMSSTSRATERYSRRSVWYRLWASGAPLQARRSSWHISRPTRG